MHRDRRAHRPAGLTRPAPDRVRDSRAALSGERALNCGNY